WPAHHPGWYPDLDLVGGCRHLPASGPAPARTGDRPRPRVGSGLSYCPAVMVIRRDGRQPDELRPVELVRDYTTSAAGSVLIRVGRTVVLCTASVADEVPR